MTPKNSDAPAWATGASNTLDGSGQHAVCAADASTSRRAMQASGPALVALLTAIWQRRPRLGAALGRIVLAVWPGMRGA